MQYQSQALNTYLNNALRQGEKVLWRHEGAGATTWYLFSALYGFLFLTVWCGLVARFVLGSLFSGDVFALFFALPFLIGFVIWFGCLWLLLRRKKFAYAVTDQRVFVMNSFWPSGARVFGPDQVQSMLRLGAPEKGTIKLSGSGMAMWNQFSGDFYTNLFYPAKLVNIPNSAKVERLIYDNVAARINTMPQEEKTGYKANPNRKPNLFHGE